MSQTTKKENKTRLHSLIEKLENSKKFLIFISVLINQQLLLLMEELFFSALALPKRNEYLQILVNLDKKQPNVYLFRQKYQIFAHALGAQIISFLTYNKR